MGAPIGRIVKEETQSPPLVLPEGMLNLPEAWPTPEADPMSWKLPGLPEYSEEQLSSVYTNPGAKTRVEFNPAAGWVRDGVQLDARARLTPLDFGTREEWDQYVYDYNEYSGINEMVSIESLVEARSPEAIDIITASTEGAAEIARLGGEAAIEELAPYTGRGEGIDALQEQRALLGLLGPEAQQQAIAGIQDTPFQKEKSLREQRTLLRQAAAGGELGGGATIAGMATLAGAQAGERILGRYEQLQPLVDIAQTTSSGISRIEEDARAREMQYISSLGPQIGNILLGQAAPIVKGRTQAAELSGLATIGEAQQRGQMATGIANLAGETNFFGLGNLVNQPAPTVTNVLPPPGSVTPAATYPYQPGRV